MALDLRVLVVEDERDAVDLMVRLLRESERTVRYRHVDTAAAFVEALESDTWHVILADYMLPDFSAPEALRLTRERGLDIPVIVVSGRVGEETAAEMMRAGADDFVNKINLSRLLPAVERAVSDAAERQRRRDADEVRLKLDTNLRNVVRENVDGMVILGEDGSVLFANPAVEALLGREQVEFLGQEFGTPAFERGSVEIQLVQRSGALVFVEMRATPTEWEGTPAILLSLRDITERKEAEKHLRRLNRALTVLSHCNKILVRAREEQELLDEVCRIVVEEGGYRFGWVGLVEAGDLSTLRPVAMAGHEAGYLDAIGMRNGGPPGTCPAMDALGRGEPFVVQDIAAEPSAADWRDAASGRGYRSAIALPVGDAAGERIGVLALYAEEADAFNPEEIALIEELAGDLAFGVIALRREIARQAAEAALRASEERFRKALIHAPLATMVHTEDGEILTLNNAWTRQTGYTLEDIPTVWDWFQQAYGEQAAEAERIMKSVYKSNKPATTGEFVVRTKSGGQCNLYFSTAPLGRLPDGRRAIIGMAMDLTDERAAQAKLVESEERVQQLQKLESIGRLAGGVAHDFNNVLHAIGGYAEFAQGEIEPGTHLYNDIAAIRQLTKRASTLTQQLLAFSRRQTLQSEVIDLNEEIVDSIKLLRRVIGEDIEVNFRPGENLAPVFADPGQLYQVIMNLAVNARDAMPYGGSLTIETANQGLDETYAERHAGVTPGDYVALTISDTGSGMDQDTKDKIFDPFFTTKRAGEGTGLGLSTVYGIIKQHGGNVWVYSELGHGTTFKIYLPRSEKEAAGDEVPIPPRAARGGGETILIAEDEAPVRYVLTRVLQNGGYDVIAAESADDTIALAVESQKKIALLITDVVMPGKSGPELHAEIQQRIPGLRALFMSGYTDDTVFKYGILTEGTPFIQKPFTARDLLKAVRDMIDTGHRERSTS